MTKSYSIFATLGDDLERIIEADFLDDVDLSIVKSKVKEIFDRSDAFWNKLNAMDEHTRDEYELNGGEFYFDYPYFIFDNNKHRDLICYLTLAGIGIPLNDFDLPDCFNRHDSIVLVKELV